MPERFINVSNAHEQLLHHISDEYIMGEVLYDSKGQPFDFQIVEVNESFLRSKGFTLEHIIGKSYRQIFGCKNSQLLDICLHTSQDQQTREKAFYITEQALHGQVRVASLETGQFTALITNLSNLLPADESRKLSYQKFMVATETAQMAVWEYDLDQQRITYANARWHEMFGIDNAKDVSQIFTQCIPDEDFSILKESFDFARKPENAFKTYEYQYRYHHPKTGKLHWYRNKGYIIRDEQGNRTIGFGLDISAEKTMLEDMRREKQFYEAMSSKTNAAFFIWEIKSEKFQYINDEYARLFEYTLSELNEQSRMEVRRSMVKPKYHEELAAAMDRVKNGESRVPVVYEVKGKTGDYFFCQAMYSPFEYDNEGHVKSIIASLIDISDIKKQEQKVIQANLQKDRFLSNMSHEIRTPLNAVLGFSRLMRTHKPSPEKQTAFMEQIEQNSKQLLMLIDDILDLSKIESGNISLKMEQCDFHHCMTNLVEAYQQKLQVLGKDHRVKINFIPPPKGLEINAYITDIGRTKQILTNLIDNAIKFTSDGKIDVMYHPATNNKLKIAVRDSGIGIPQKDLTKIFERFAQSSQNPELAIQGTGLGLAITKGLVTQLGGEIHVESQEGKGSCFQILLPFDHQMKLSTPVMSKPLSTDQTSDQSIKVKKVLVVDDNESVQFYYRSLLEDYEVETIVATNGKQAVDIYQLSPDFDLVLMDINMPVMDGPTAMREIRKINPTAVIIAQSAFAMNEETKKYEKMGFTEYITKPVSEEALKKYLFLE